jgi:FtsH-binding integral membrane protein
MAAQTQVAVVSFHSSQALFFGPAFLTYLSWSSRLTKFELCNASILGVALATVGCFAAIIYFSRKHVTFSRKSDQYD